MEAEIKAKLKAFVATRFDGDAQKCFTYYTMDNCGLIHHSEILELLKDAGIDGLFLRNAIASLAIAKADTNHDGAISWPEAQAAAAAYGVSLT